MAYENKKGKRTSFVKGKFYHIDALQEDLTGNVLCNMFRKPLVGETTPDGITYTIERFAELSDYSMCKASFSITVSILFNQSELNDTGAQAMVADLRDSL